MSSFRYLIALCLALGLSACGSFEATTRNAPLDATMPQMIPLSVDVQKFRVVVPRTLSVSEANMYYPKGDIVWRGDPMGDRHEQVKAIFEAALEKGVGAAERGSLPVIMDVQVTRFHALSQKARYTVGGVHALQFAIIMRNPETGEIYGAPRHVKADFRALGGAEATTAERHGITQKSRIIDHLAEVIETHLTDPEAFRAQKLGLLGAINQM